MPVKTAEDKKWEAEDDLRTLRRAKEIQDSPSRVKAATKVAEEEIKALNDLTKSKTLLA